MFIGGRFGSRIVWFTVNILCRWDWMSQGLIDVVFG
jgi:hypothetical protein